MGIIGRRVYAQSVRQPTSITRTETRDDIEARRALDAARVRARWKDAVGRAQAIYYQEYVPAWQAVHGQIARGDPDAEKKSDALARILNATRGDFDENDIALDLTGPGMHPGMHAVPNFTGQPGASLGHRETEADVKKTEAFIIRMRRGVEQLARLHGPGFEQDVWNYQTTKPDDQSDDNDMMPVTPRGGGVRASRGRGAKSDSSSGRRGSTSSSASASSSSTSDHSTGRGGADSGTERDVRPPAPSSTTSTDTAQASTDSKGAGKDATPAPTKIIVTEDLPDQRTRTVIVITPPSSTPDPEGGSDDRAPPRRAHVMGPGYNLPEMKPHYHHAPRVPLIWADRSAGSANAENDRGGNNPRFYLEKPNPEDPHGGGPRSREAFPNPDDATGSGVGPRGIVERDR